MTMIFSGGCMICQKYVQIFENVGREVRNFVVVVMPACRRGRVVIVVIVMVVSCHLSLKELIYKEMDNIYHIR